MHGQRYRPSSLGLVNVIFHWIVFMLSLIKDFVCLVVCSLMLNLRLLSQLDLLVIMDFREEHLKIDKSIHCLQLCLFLLHCLLFLDTLLGGFYIIRN